MIKFFFGLTGVAATKFNFRNSRIVMEETNDGSDDRELKCASNGSTGM